MVKHVHLTSLHSLSRHFFPKQQKEEQQWQSLSHSPHINHHWIFFYYFIICLDSNEGVYILKSSAMSLQRQFSKKLIASHGLCPSQLLPRSKKALWWQSTLKILWQSRGEKSVLRCSLTAELERKERVDGKQCWHSGQDDGTYPGRHDSWERSFTIESPTPNSLSKLFGCKIIIVINYSIILYPY